MDRTAWLDLETALSSGPLRSVVGYRRSVQLGVDDWAVAQSDFGLGATWSVTRPPSPLRAFRGLLFDGFATYDQARGGWRSVRLGASASFGIDSYVHVSLTRDMEVGRSTGELRVVLRPGFMTATTSAYRSASGSGVSQEVRGVVAYDADLGRLVPRAREWLGRGGMTVRMFLDADGDGRFDADETVLPAGPVRFRQPVRIESDGDLLRVHDLLPYHRYEAEIDPASVPDPALVPAFTTFSFVADPNVYRSIDVPLQEAGELDGRVLRRAAVGYEGIAGLKVHVRREGEPESTILQTFSDGGFYAFGLAPGRYLVSLDTAQLRTLGVRAEPQALAIDIASVARAPSAGVRFALEPSTTGATVAQAAVNVEPDSANDVPALLDAVRDAEARGDLTLAIEVSHRLLLIDPDDLDAYVRLGRLYRARGDLARARDAYRRILSLNSDLPLARRELGLVLFDLGEKVEATVVLRNVLREAPNDEEVRTALSALERG